MTAARAAFAAGGIAFLVYLYTLGPGLVPYRDAGEMTTSVPTLGILHPPGYPTYSLLGNVISRLPLGGPAYRLNLFSALAMAGAWAILMYWVISLREMASRETRAALLATALLGALSYEFWWHALISEMYALHILFLAGLLWAWWKRCWTLGAFLFGVGLGNRLDLLLTAPAFFLAIVLDSSARAEWTPKRLISTAVWTLAGLSVYLYLPIRASQVPWINWNDPSTLESLWRTLSRSGYGGGLDLLSQSYQPLENFSSEMWLYLVHLKTDFTWPGILLALFGFYKICKPYRSLAALIGMGWLLTGPLFIALGNLPPNSHAVAIMEAAYLAPDFFFLLALLMGTVHLWSLLARSPAFAPWQSAGVVLLWGWIGYSAWTTYPTVTKRENFLAVDFARQVWRAVPSSSLVVARSDVPLFSLWAAHWGKNSSMGRVPVAQGLAASPWYQRMMRRQDTPVSVGALRDAGGWNTLVQSNPGWRVFALNEIDWPAEGMTAFRPHGFVVEWLPGHAAGHAGAGQSGGIEWSRHFLTDILYRRDLRRYGDYRDFFSNELIEHEAKSWLPLQDDTSVWRAWSLKPDMPYAPFQLAYAAYTRKDWNAAEHLYRETVRLFLNMEDLGRRWKALPDLQRMIQTDREQAENHLRVVLQQKS